MPAYRLVVRDEATNVNLAAVTYTTYACDASGAPVAGNPPAGGGWRATWCVAGKAGTHAPVVPSGRLLATENEAYEAARKAIYGHYENSIQGNVRIVDK